MNDPPRKSIKRKKVGSQGKLHVTLSPKTNHEIDADTIHEPTELVIHKSIMVGQSENVKLESSKEHNETTTKKWEIIRIN